MLWLALKWPEPGAPAAATLACWAGRYTPTLSLDAEHPDELLLEVESCLRLFGGLARLCELIVADLHALDLAARCAMAVAPAPRAAQWLARAQPVGGAAALCLERAALAAALAPLPVGVIHPTEATAAALTAYGVRTLGALLALPRAGLARRLGTALVRQLAQALGEVPDPRPAFRFPERFAQGLELPAKVEDAARLLFAGERLLAALAGWLHARQAGVAQCVLRLVHEDAPASELVLGFASPTRERERLRRVLAERLARCTLPAAVLALRLEANTPLPLSGRSDSLFGDSEDAALDAVIERLRARLGAEAVHGLKPHPDHRPEAATRSSDCAPPFAKVMGAQPLRPLWLLPAPQALAEIGGQPAWRGAVLSAPSFAERIESGWWDSASGLSAGLGAGMSLGAGLGDIRRDYLIATAPQGERLWVFHDGARWWLHGVFA